MTELTSATVGSLRVPVPAYDRRAVTPGIVHVGVGGFHRAHQAVFVDRLLAIGERSWGICGVGTQPGDRRMRDVLHAQDGLYTVVVKHPSGRREAQVVGSIVDHRYAPDDVDAVVERMAAASTEIVSLTITEGGYDIDEPAVLLDVQRPGEPTTAFGIVTAALVRRRARGLRPFAILSCDNVAGNGAVARDAFVGFAGRIDGRLADWVLQEVAFPSSMVDRITPVTTDGDRVALAEEHGIEDAWPVVCEPFLQWVMEDVPGAVRPPWEQVGVQMVADVHPYEVMKLRLLNAGHQAIGYLGALAGHVATDEVLADDDLRAFLRGYLELEASPTLPPVPGIDLAAYRESLLERFGNRAIRDTLARLCAFSSDRVPGFLLPVVQDRLARGGSIDRCALVCAAWARYATGRDDEGRPLAVVDRLLDVVVSAADEAQRTPAAFLHRTGVFGTLTDDPRFVEAFTDQLRALQALGARGAIRRLLEAQRSPSA